MWCLSWPNREGFYLCEMHKSIAMKNQDLATDTKTFNSGNLVK